MIGKNLKQNFEEDNKEDDMIKNNANHDYIENTKDKNENYNSNDTGINLEETSDQSTENSSSLYQEKNIYNNETFIINDMNDQVNMHDDFNVKNGIKEDKKGHLNKGLIKNHLREDRKEHLSDDLKEDFKKEHLIDDLKEDRKEELNEDRKEDFKKEELNEDRKEDFKKEELNEDRKEDFKKDLIKDLKEEMKEDLKRLVRIEEKILSCSKENKESENVIISTYKTNIKSSNIIKNTKYSLISFVPMIFLGQFKTKSSFFFFFIMIIQWDERFAVSSFESSFFPFIFVLALSAVNEGLDDYRRYRRDRSFNNEKVFKYKINKGAANEINKETFINDSKLDLNNSSGHVNEEDVKLEKQNNQRFKSEISAELKAGDIILVKKGERMPADCIILSSLDENGEVFIRTDQLDGETDWKARKALIELNEIDTEIIVTTELPNKDIYSFNGTLETKSVPPIKLSLELDNTAWCDTIVANTDILGLVIYTGAQTRAKMNTYEPRSKTGLFDHEVDEFVTVLIVITCMATILFTFMRVTHLSWDVLIIFFRFLVLFSYIIPIALQVTINMARLVYSMDAPPGIIVRTSSIQEELGRISYFLTDKTGTLTMNEMKFKRIHLGNISYTDQNIPDISNSILKFREVLNSTKLIKRRTKKDLTKAKLYSLIEALSVCHSVTPVLDDNIMTYQASSPDEISIIKFLEDCGVKLISNMNNIFEISYQIEGKIESCKYEICCVFAFNSNTKRMGVVAKRLNYKKDLNKNISSEKNLYSEKNQSSENPLYSQKPYVFFVKGADSSVVPLCTDRSWVNEEVDNMAREGLRTLVIAKKEMTENEFNIFMESYSNAKMALIGRAEKLLKVQSSIEQKMKLLGVTGVEDKLQDRVRESLESLRSAEIKIWMLTGDKIETAISIGKSSRLISRTDRYMIISGVKTKKEIEKSLKQLCSTNYNCLVIDGDSIGVILDDSTKKEKPVINDKLANTRDKKSKIKISDINMAPSLLELFVAVTKNLSTVIGCRYTPTQKANMATALRKISGEIVCCIGDGGNDVSMITEADVGIGIEGKEGNQASLASDFSMKSFSLIIDLLFVHGRNSYKNSAKLAHLTIQRGTMQAVVQGIFSALISSYPLSILQGRMPIFFIVFSSLPLLSLFRCYDVLPSVSRNYPEIYSELKNYRLCSFKEFVSSNLLTFIQATIIIMGYKFFVDEKTIFSILVFISIIFNEYLMVLLVQANRFIETSALCLISLLLFIVSSFFINEMGTDFETFKSYLITILLINTLAILPKLIIKLDHIYFRPAPHVRLTRSSCTFIL